MSIKQSVPITNVVLTHGPKPRGMQSRSNDVGKCVLSSGKTKRKYARLTPALAATMRNNASSRPASVAAIETTALTEGTLLLLFSRHTQG